MSWQSMFDGGACKVEVWGAELIWSGILGKGDTSPSFDTSANTGCTVSVDAAGVVTLACVTGDDPGGMALYVEPQYDTSALKTRMIDISAWRFGATQNYTGIAQCDISPTGDVALNFSTSPATPSSAEFAAHEPGAHGASVGVSYESIG